MVLYVINMIVASGCQPSCDIRVENDALYKKAHKQGSERRKGERWII